MESYRAEGAVRGWLQGASVEPIESPLTLANALGATDRVFAVVEAEGRLGLASPSEGRFCGSEASGAMAIKAFVPACGISELGDPAFCRAHGLRFPYVAGAMANGICSLDIVAAMGEAGMLGFFGSGGLSLGELEDAIVRVRARMGNKPFGFNLLYNPFEGGYEAAAVDLYLRHGVGRICAAAYLDLTLPLVRYRTSGIRRDEAGRVVAPNLVFGKVSRVEVARKFFSPPPERFLRELVELGELKPEQAAMAAAIPMAQDVTVEADSAGHTDRSPAICQLPSMIALRDRAQAEFRYDPPLRVGAAGGIATPQSAVSAFAMGAAYVMTGSINQACRESGTSDAVRVMLAGAGQADVAMAPAADMFEMGIRLQVLKRGTMFAMRAQKLYDIYRGYSRLEDVPTDEIETLEKTFFRAPLSRIWDETRRFWLERDPESARRADRDPKHRMALVFRWYLGQSSRWAIAGEPDRAIDYQIWCGPAMGAFNEWAKGSYLEDWENRRVVDLAYNILRGCAILKRSETLAMQGIRLPPGALDLSPREPEELKKCQQ